MGESHDNSLVAYDRDHDQITESLQRKLPSVVVFGESGHRGSTTRKLSCLANSARDFVKQESAVAHPLALVKFDSFGELERRFGM
jgi:hypothetical protein